MADAAAARREARRRRILENSQDRLQRIAGKSLPDETSHPASLAPVQTSLVDEEWSLPTTAHAPLAQLYNGYTDSVPQLNLRSIVQDSPELTDFLQNVSEGTSSLLSSMPGEETTPPAPTTWERLSATKLDIIFVSILVQITYSLFWVGSDSGNIFLPLMAYDATKVWTQRGSRDSGVVSAMLLMNGFSPTKVHSIMRIVKVLLMFAQDICIYLFFTVCMQALFMYFYGKKIQLA